MSSLSSTTRTVGLVNGSSPLESTSLSCASGTGNSHRVIVPIVRRRASSRLGGNRHGEENAACARLALHPDAATMRLDDRFADVEPEACAAPCVTLCRPVRIEEVLDVLRRNAGTAVSNEIGRAHV